MAITGTQIMERVNYLLNDTSNVRWTSAEKLLWLNDGRREMAQGKPEIFGGSSEVTHTLAAGAKQRITTTGAYKFVSADSNVTSGRAIRPTTQGQLDSFKPDWRSDTGDDVENYFADTTDPLAFWIYPVATGDLKCHAYVTPTDLAALTDTALPFDQYEPILVNYILFRAYSKEDEAGSAQKAAAYQQLFTTALKE